MMRWVAGLVAVLVLPACGDGSGSGSGSESGTGAPGVNPSGPPVGQPPSVRITRPDSGTSAREGSKITIHAVVTAPEGSIVRVEFYDHNRLIGSKSSPPYTITYGRLKAGTSELCAVAIDGEGNPTASPPVTLFVVRGKGDDKDDDDKDDD